MEGCSGGGCGLRKGLIEDVKLWSTSLKDLLASSEGREELKNFLMDCDFENELSALTFWEQCNEIVSDYQNLKKLASSSGRYHDNAATELLYKANTVMDEYVHSYNVNLDEQMIASLNDCLKTKNPDRIADIFQEAKGWAHNLLKEIHSMFSVELLKKYNLSE